MPVQTRCPGCNKLLSVSSKYAGKQRECPICKATVSFPAPSAAGSGSFSALPAASTLVLPTGVPRTRGATRSAVPRASAAPRPLGVVECLALTAGVAGVVLLSCAMLGRWQEGTGLQNFPLVFALALAAGGLAVVALARASWAPITILLAGVLVTPLLVRTAAALGWSSAPPPAPLQQSGWESGKTATPPPVAVPPVKAPRDVIVVLEDSEAMRPHLEGVKRDLHAFADKLLATDRDARIGLVTFHNRAADARPGGVAGGPDSATSPFTRKLERFSEEVGKLRASGGGDLPESILDALALAARQPYRDDADKVLILITDTTPHVPDKEIASVEQALGELRAKKIKQLHLVVPEYETYYRHVYHQYQEMQDAIPGRLFPLSTRQTVRPGRPGGPGVPAVPSKPLSDEDRFIKLLPEVGQQIAELTIGGGDPGKGAKVDVVFVLDVTGSMGAQINGCKRGISAFAAELFKRKLDAQIGLVAFGDQMYDAVPFEVLDFDPAARQPFIKPLPGLRMTPPGKLPAARRPPPPKAKVPFTKDPDLFSQRVGLLRLKGGGDTPESSMDALNLACLQPFRPDAEKVFILVTDAAPRVPDTFNQNVAQIVAVLKKREVKQLHVIAPATEERRKLFHKEFDELNKGMAGKMFPLAGDETAFVQMLPQVGQQIAETSAEQRGLTSAAKRLKVDVMFVLDVTGSMQAQINGVTRGVSSFARELLSRKVDARIGLIGFRDQKADKIPFEVLQFPAEPLDLTAPRPRPTVAEMKARPAKGEALTAALPAWGAELTTVTPAARAVGPQSGLDALAFAARQPFRPGSERTILFVGASSPRVPDGEMLAVGDVVDELTARKVEHLHLVVPAAEQQTFRPLLATLRGQLVRLDGPRDLTRLAQRAEPPAPAQTLAQAPAPAPEPPAPTPPPQPVLGAGAGAVFGLIGLIVAAFAFGLAAWLRPLVFGTPEGPDESPGFFARRGTLLAGQGLALVVGIVLVLGT